MRIKTCNLLILFNEVKELFLLIITIKNIHEFNVLRLIYGYFAHKSSTLHWHTLPCFHWPSICIFADSEPIPLVITSSFVTIRTMLNIFSSRTCIKPRPLFHLNQSLFNIYHNTNFYEKVQSQQNIITIGVDNHEYHTTLCISY
jgi:hypothetical protein